MAEAGGMTARFIVRPAVIESAAVPGERPKRTCVSATPSLHEKEYLR
jgi:hypothetical protein